MLVPNLLGKIFSALFFVTLVTACVGLDQRDNEAVGAAVGGATGGDGTEMILIPAGEFWMGSSPAAVTKLTENDCNRFDRGKGTCRTWVATELPAHRVVLDAFYLDRYEVTNALFDRFVRATGHKTTGQRDGHG